MHWGLIPRRNDMLTTENLIIAELNSSIGLSGFETVGNLWEDSSQIPKERGVYFVLHPNHECCRFVVPGVGGFFKGKNPNVSIQELESNRVSDAPVIYIGKAGSPAGKATLRSRLRQYLKFGLGRNIGHWGGRHIWQVSNPEDLIICWKTTLDQDPREVEKGLIAEFVATHGKLPFANLKL
jgi:hypothetical protein